MNSIDLELSIMNNEDTIIDFLCESIMDDSKLDLLTESVGLLIENSEYSNIAKAVSEYNDLKKQFSSSEDNEQSKNIFKKLIAKVKGIVNWWYKEEPGKKFKTFRVVLTILVSITMIILTIKGPGAVKVADKLLTTKVGKVITGASYKGSNKFFQQRFSDSAIATGIIKGLYAILLAEMQRISDKVRDKINLKNIDDNIKACDNSIEKLNGILRNMDDNDPNKANVERQVKDIEDVLKSLTKTKAKQNQENEEDNGEGGEE